MQGFSKLKKRNKLIKVADKSPGGWTTVRKYEEPSLCGSDSEDDRKLKQAEARAIKKIKLSHKPSTVQAHPNYNGIEKSSSHFMPSDVSRSGASFQFNGGPAWGRGRGAFHFEDNDKRQHQTSVSPVDLQGTSDDRVITKTVPKGSSSSIGVPLSYRDLKQTKEKSSQQSSQEINDKYFLSTFPSETMLTDLFSLHEQYFEIQEKEFLTSSTNVKGRLTENIGFWETIGANP